MYGGTASKDFIGKAAPPNYVAGLGRGATGFTTRLDLGPAREGPTQAEIEAAHAKMEEEDEERYEDPDNETGLFNSLPYEADDEEADKIYEAIDKKMDERRKARREKREQEELLKYRAERPKIQQQFADLKRNLATMSEDDWFNIPDVGNISGKRSKKASLKERYTPVPDSLLEKAKQENQMLTQLDAQQQKMGGLATPNIADNSGTLTNFVDIGAARGQVLGLKLDQISDSVSGQTTVDPKGYLTDLNSIVIKSDAEIGDIKKARLLLKSVITTNPKHGPGWICAARLEEVAGKIVQARAVIEKGCEQCPTSEDVWLEAARLNSIDNAKVILANAVRHVPTSVKIWLQASQLEKDDKAKKRVLRRALEFIPNSVKLWKQAISMEESPEDAKILLSRAVECIPLSVELWLALAKLETYENAKKVLNRARVAIPTSHEIWITAARLEEQQGNESMVDLIISRAVTALSQKGTVLDRDQWLKEAEGCEKLSSILTCQAIVRSTIGLDVEEEDRKKTWMDDAESFISHGSIQTARAIYAHALKVFPGKKSIWRRAAFLEKNHGTRESLEELLIRAVKYCPQAEVLWLMAAKEKWLAGDINGARDILTEAFRANTNSEQIWLAAVKLESENGEYARAQLLLQKAREQAGTEIVWMKSIVLERQLSHIPSALKIIEEALVKYPTFPKIWMIKGQIEDSQNELQKARETYAQGLKKCPKSIPLWILASRLEEKAGLAIKARSLLEKARLLNPKTPELFVESVRVEQRANNLNMAKAMMAKGLQECTSSGLLWSEAIMMESTPKQRRSRSMDAFNNCDNDPLVTCTIARLFWSERKIDKARKWFERAVQLNPDLGDIWAYLLKFELQHGTEQSIQSVIDRCVNSDPHHGEVWATTRKDLTNQDKHTRDILRLVAEKLA
jgi:pre-mRNA-processing factor 6